MNVLSKLGSVLSLMRPANGALMYLATVVGFFVSTRSLPHPITNLLLFATAFSLNSSSMIVNDLLDIEVDRVNAPWRPLPSGRVRRLEAIVSAALLGFVGLFSALILSYAAFAVASLAYLIAIVYNFRLKPLSLIGNAAVSVTVVAPFIFGSVVGAGEVVFSVQILGALAFLASMGREVIKGIPDVGGDVARNVRTVASLYGSRVAALLGASLFLTAVALSPLPYVTGSLGVEYLVTVTVADAGFVYESVAILRRHDGTNALRVKRRALMWMFIALISFMIGTR